MFVPRPIGWGFLFIIYSNIYIINKQYLILAVLSDYFYLWYTYLSINLFNTFIRP